MTPLSDTTRAGAWLQAARALFDKGDRIYNLILEVHQPSAATPASRAIEKQVDDFLREHECQPNQTVAETIFPATEYMRGGLDAVLAYPTTVYPFIKPANHWGTYALRITERKCSDGSTFKPLEFLIDKLRKQLTLRGAKRATYELDTMAEPLDLKLYEADVDRNNAVAGQCLSHLSFKLGPNHELYLTALYRYQWFVQKALGNLLGLARLQNCIAREINVPVGPLVCHATLAILEDKKVQKVPWDPAALIKLIENCENCLAIVDPEEATA